MTPRRPVPSPAVRVALDARDELGESPWWDAVASELVRTDITRGRVLGWAPAEGATWSLDVDGDVGAVVPRTRGGLLLAVARTLRVREPDGDVREIARVEPGLTENRLNDCRADPSGRLWAGTMSKRRTPGTAALYRVEPSGHIERVLSGTTISNGLGWSPDGERMYFIDSTTQRIDVFDFDAAEGTISDRRTLAEIDPADGLPDGLAVDAEGGVWVCLFGGAAIRRYSPDGALDAATALPVTNPTCPAFGGPSLATLYVTSARHKLTPEQRAAEPCAGAVLELDPGVRGLPANRFAG